MTTTPLETLLSRLHGVQRVARGYVAQCPAHADQRASLSISLGRDDRILLHCFAGCEPEAILETLSLTWGDLFTTPREPNPHRPARIACDLDEVRQALLAKERRLADRRARSANMMALAEEAKQVHRLVARARQLVTTLGPDDDRAWDLAAQATTLERLMLNAEAGRW
jgi:hypothetical protein